MLLELHRSANFTITVELDVSNWRTNHLASLGRTAGTGVTRQFGQTLRRESLEGNEATMLIWFRAPSTRGAATIALEESGLHLTLPRGLVDVVKLLPKALDDVVKQWPKV